MKPQPEADPNEALRRLRVALEHPRHVEADQLETAYRIQSWIRWAGLGDTFRVHIRDRAIAVFDGRRFHPLESPRPRTPPRHAN